MIEAFKDWAKRHWPALRLRTILLSVLVVTAPAGDRGHRPARL